MAKKEKENSCSDALIKNAGWHKKKKKNLYNWHKKGFQKAFIKPGQYAFKNATFSHNVIFR